MIQRSQKPQLVKVMILKSQQSISQNELKERRDTTLISQKFSNVKKKLENEQKKKIVNFKKECNPKNADELKKIYPLLKTDQKFEENNVGVKTKSFKYCCMVKTQISKTPKVELIIKSFLF